MDSDKKVSGQKRRQFRALFLKNMSVQMKQSGTNCCQIVTPLICIMLVFVIKSVSKDIFPASSASSATFPFVFNVPEYYLLLQQQKKVKQSTCLEWFSFQFGKNVSQSTRNYVGNNTGTGQSLAMLSNLEQSPCLYKDKDGDWSYAEVPFFQETQQQNQDLFDDLQILNTQKYTRKKDQPGLAILPDGAIQFNEASADKLNYKVQVNDVMLPEYHRLNSFSKIELLLPKNVSNKTSANLIVAEGQLALVDLVNRAYINTIDPKAELVSGSMYMPMSSNNDQYIAKLINMSGGSLFPLALGLLLPVFMYQMVLEKETKIIQMMKMNGLKMSIYWSTNFLFNFTIYTITVLVFMFFGVVLLKMTFFTSTSPWLFLIVFIGWGLAQISMAFCVQVFINKAKTASIIGYLLSIWLILTAVSFNIGIYPYPLTLPYGLRIVPTFAFCRIIYRMAEACSQDLCLSQMSILHNGVNQEIIDCIVWIYVSSIIFLLLAVYLDQVVPQDYGINKPALFPLHYLKKVLTRQSNKQVLDETVNTINQDLQINMSLNDKSMHSNLDIGDPFEDEDSREERKLALGMSHPQVTYPLVIKDIRKEYSGSGQNNKVAVKQLSLTVRNGEILGLLGPNGAGKTSLISMLTGLYKVTKGDAFINDCSIVQNIEQAQKDIGICPQFDLLWPQLTIKEHLLFYVRLKGVHRSQELIMVNKAMESVLLTKHQDKESQQLSGGMRRRLSVAISMVGEPKVIFLDEPTTGLDPENKRQLWDIITEQQKRNNQSVVITTHSMEEADVLCNRIGIMQDGVLRCIAPQLRLKQKYGGGYHLTINLKKENTFHYQPVEFQNDSHNTSNVLLLNNTTSQIQEQEKPLDNRGEYQKCVDNVISFVEEMAGGTDQVVLVNRVNGNLDFIVKNTEVKISQIFLSVEENKNRLFIQEWGINQSSLEDVFVHIVSGNNEINDLA